MIKSANSQNDVPLEALIPDGAVSLESILEYIGAIQDVTERRLSEEALSKVRSDLAEVTRLTSFGALTAAIAHEVNQPLSGIVTNASTCLLMLAGDPPDFAGARETARRTVCDGNRASEVVTRLRALFAKKRIAAESVDLNEATRGVIALSLSGLQRTGWFCGLHLPQSSRLSQAIAPASHPKPAPECVRRDEHRRRSFEAVADQN